MFSFQLNAIAGAVAAEAGMRDRDKGGGETGSDGDGDCAFAKPAF